MLSNQYHLSPLLVAVLVGRSLGTVPYSEYILAPASRTLYPVSVYNINGSVSDAASLLGGPNGQAIFNGVSALTLDFGKNIAGLVSIEIESASSADSFIGLTYTESSLYVSNQHSDATNNGVDIPLWWPVGQQPEIYVVDEEHVRGGFRYLTVINNSTAVIEVSSVTVNFTAAPDQDLQNYNGYFHCNEELLNRIWYAGAYTNQLCTISPQQGNSLGGTLLPNGHSTWGSGETITDGNSCLVDGAKRDRVVWPGDMAVAVPSIFVSTNDLASIRNSLDSLLTNQREDGLFPYSGIPVNGAESFTYHLHTLIGIDLDYYFSGNKTYFENNWTRYVRGINWSLEQIDDTGLMNVTNPADWLREGMGGHNIEANAILYYVLNRGLLLAEYTDDTSVVTSWEAAAEGIKKAANSLLWNSELGLYTDNETTSLAPQDGNSWAVKAGLTQNISHSAVISNALRKRWGPYGAPAPESKNGTTISPFIGSIELDAHFKAENPTDALDLMRLQWGYMLDDPRMTNSTFIEGFSMDGSIRYPPYDNDYRVSHAHGWSSGPTYLLTFYVAGLQLTNAAGESWKIAPMPGDLKAVDAGYSTSLGDFKIKYYVPSTDDVITAMTFSTPIGTEGSVSLPGSKGLLRSADGVVARLDVNGTADGLAGGDWQFEPDSPLREL